MKHEYHTSSQRIFPVICDDGEILVTASLHHALRMLQVLDLRKVKKIGTKQKFFWIDAICIDQENIEERGSQVAIMANIYQAASTVIIWLGEEDEFTSDACTVIDRLSKVSSDRYSVIKPTHWWDQGPTLRKIGTKPIDFRNWLGFLAFMNRPWFKRAWIVQELILAKLPVIVCGSVVILWETVSRTIDFLINTGWYNHLHTEWLKVHHPIILKTPGPYSRLLQSNTDVGMAALYLQGTRSGIKTHGKLAILRYLLEAHRYTESTDPRDKIYAFLGLSRKDRPPFSTHPSAITPDYTLPVQTLYTNVTKIMLQSYGDLRLLPNVEDRSRTKIQGLSSWVPDYSVQLQPHPLSTLGNCKWCAAGHHCWKPDSRELSAQLLNVQGVLVDTICEAVVMTDESDNLLAFWTTVIAVSSGLDDYYHITSADM